MSELQDKAAALEARRKANREAFPAVAQIVDEFTAAFGAVKVLGGTEFTTGQSFGWVRPPSPNCDSCTGHDEREGNGACSRMDYIAEGHDRPEPSKVFCGYRMARSPRIAEKEQAKGGRR
ncbi:MAG: hypothetical protein WC825_02365 [Gallionellaceae bacterium]|jgi:hypothetical protein